MLVVTLGKAIEHFSGTGNKNHISFVKDRSSTFHAQLPNIYSKIHESQLYIANYNSISKFLLMWYLQRGWKLAILRHSTPPETSDFFIKISYLEKYREWNEPFMLAKRRTLMIGTFIETLFFTISQNAFQTLKNRGHDLMYKCSRFLV